MEVDPFASAVIEDVLLHDDSVHGDRLGEFTTTVFGALPKSSDSSNGGGDDVQMATPRKRDQPSRAASATADSGVKVRKPRRKNPETTQLTIVQPDAQPEKNFWLTLFIYPTSQQIPEQVDRKPKRQRQGDCVPVAVWPQYKVRDEPGTFVVLAHTELWVSTILHTLRGRGAKANSMRILNKNFANAIRTMLREGLCNTQQAADSDDESETEGAKPNTPAKLTFSGFKLATVFLLKANVAGLPITVVNYGKLLIMKLDEEGIRFINKVVIDVVQRLSDTTETVANGKGAVSVEAGFRFDQSMPNIPDKVLWDPSTNSWKLILSNKGRPKRASFVDEDGKPLGVTEGLTADKHDVAKANSDARAIQAWNHLDKSDRKRITMPLQIHVPPPAVSGNSEACPESDSQDTSTPASDAMIGQTLSLESKWAQESFSIKL